MAYNATESVARSAMDVAAKDSRDYIWYPWTPVGVKHPVMAEGNGYRVCDREGGVYIDGIAGALNMSCGYNRPELIAAAAKQMATLPHYDMTSGTSMPTMELANALAAILPRGLRRILFANSGSEAVEAAVRIAWDYWQNIGEPRQRIVSFASGYHGSTMLVQHLSGLPLLLQQRYSMPFPVTRVVLPVPPAELWHPGSLSALVAAFSLAMDETRGGPVAAVIIEPFLNVGGGIQLPPGFLGALRDLCDDTGALMVADEIFTGFGRTGRMFAVEHDDVRPDIMTMSKGLSGGYVPLSAVAATDAVYDSYRAKEPFAGLTYGHTTSGHAVACAVALATLQVIESDGLVANAETRGREILNSLRYLHDHDSVVDVRGTGLFTVVEMASPELAQQVALGARRGGLLLRVQGCSVMSAPPLVIDRTGAEELARILREATEAVA